MPVPTTQFLHAGCHSCRPAKSVKAQKAMKSSITTYKLYTPITFNCCLNSLLFWTHSRGPPLSLSTNGDIENRFFLYADYCHQTKRIKELKASHSTNANHEGKLSLQQIFHSHFLMLIYVSWWSSSGWLIVTVKMQFIHTLTVTHRRLDQNHKMILLSSTRISRQHNGW